MTSINARLTVLISAILAAAALRLVPHPPNFSPIDAMAMFSGAYLGRRWLAFVAPLAALLLSDVVLGFYHGMATVYATVALVVMIGWWVSSRRTALRIGAGSVVGSVVFFMITNFGMWLFSGFYPVTYAELSPATPPRFRSSRTRSPAISSMRCCCSADSASQS